MENPQKALDNATSAAGSFGKFIELQLVMPGQELNAIFPNTFADQ